jgi:hypothetical protein
MRPRIRSIKPEMRKDERYGRMSRDARELFNGLITMADDEGRFRALSSMILGDVFPFDEDAPRHLKKWIAEIRDSGMIVFYVVDGVPYGAFRHWRRHQKINRPTPSDLPPSPDPEVTRENSVRDHGKLTERSVSEHGENTDGSLSHAQARVPDPVLVICSLTEKLAARIRENDPKANPAPRSDRWLREMRLLLDDRGGDVAEVEQIIDWCQSDEFWRTNILSPAKLRKQFTQLVLKANASGRPLVAVRGGDQLSDLDRKRLESLDRLMSQGGDAA